MSKPFPTCPICKNPLNHKYKKYQKCPTCQVNVSKYNIVYFYIRNNKIITSEKLKNTQLAIQFNPKTNTLSIFSFHKGTSTIFHTNPNINDIKSTALKFNKLSQLY